MRNHLNYSAFTKNLIWSAVLLLSLIFSPSVRAETWSSIESEHFVVLFNGNTDAAHDIQRIAEDFYPKVTRDLGYLVGRKITIWFCESQKEFNRAASAPIQDWAIGYAYPLSARIVIRDPPAVENKRMNLSHLVKHEITHVVFGLFIGQNLKYVPRWFNEGVAMYESGEWSYSQDWIMLTGSLGNSLIPLYELAEDFPAQKSRAQMAYAQSCSIVTFMVDEYGIESLRECISLMAEGRGINEAMAAATGVDTFDLERRWSKHLKSRYKWISLLSSWVVLWGFITLLVIIAYWWRKTKNRRIIQQWEEEERWAEFDEDEDSESIWL